MTNGNRWRRLGEAALLGIFVTHSPELPPWLGRSKRREIFLVQSIMQGQLFPDLLVTAKSIAPLRNTVSALVVSCVNESPSLVFVQVGLGESKGGDNSS